jgi:hypothetical protein
MSEVARCECVPEPETNTYEECVSCHFARIIRALGEEKK